MTIYSFGDIFFIIISLLFIFGIILAFAIYIYFMIEYIKEQKRENEKEERKK